MVYVWVGLALLCSLPASALFGDWLGRRKSARYDLSEKPERERSYVVPNALLALTGLLIGFTFAMAQRHYDSREQIVLAEASHIKTTYDRTQLLDDARGEELRALLRRYVDARLAFEHTGWDRARMDAEETRSEAIGDEIWSRVAAAARDDMHSVMLAQLVQSTNQMLDAADEHLAALENPLPPTVFVVLGLVTAAALAAVGFASSADRRRNWLALLVMPLLLAVVTMLVFDISYPRLGVVHVHDPILVRLKQTF